MSFELAFRSRVASIMETLTATALQDICQLMGETYAALRVEMVHEQNQSSRTKLQEMENGTGVENPANCMERIHKLSESLRNFPVVEQILNEQEANGLWLEGDPTVEDEGPPSLVPEGEEPAQPLSQTTDMGVETWPAPPVIKQEEMDDDDMESQAYDKWIPVTHWANQNITGESDEQERSQSSGGSKELGLDDFKTEPSPLLVSAEDAAPPIKKKYDKRYTCEICGKTENKKARMTSHMRKHTGLPFNCDICGEKFQCQKLLTRHKRFNHYTGIIYSCSVCGKTFMQVTSRDTHERGHTGKNYWCSDCGETFKERQERDTHECIVYKGDRPFSCSECNKDFERQYHLKKHQLEKHSLMVEQTVEPEPESKDIEDQQSQFESESSEAPTHFTCDICGMTIMNKGNINRHMLTHTKKPFSCDICGENFKRKAQFTRHQGKHAKVEEKVEKPYSCTVCGMMFVYSKMRNNHERKHIGEDYCCSDCGKKFKERQEHECIVYKGDQPVRCSECNEDFERQYHLKQHQLEKHPLLVDQTVDPEPESKDIEDQQSQLFELAESSETEAPTRFTCDICGMIIMNKGNINRHKLIHTKKPFSCDVCGENFKSHTCLAKHQGKHKSVEEKIEPYSCSMCGMRFVFPKMRDNHECKHIGEDFWCSGCDKTFKERGDRDEHKCTVYKRDRPFRCSECNEDFERQYHLKRHRLEKHPLMLDQTRPGHDTATVVQGAQPSNDNDPKADMSTLGGKVPVTNSG
ncbi:zinc finger protein 221-like isoform X3 [Oncorhynchus mykiss]|uniref:C2H2-type domain-containing protein n=1 Tax=Oncorhynchus mykiss TaxID=8022 RepID=A0A8C7PG72_ONCMY|nr:zinc finger protein 221 isoform X3 [Oncorhynchus mykiss]XP_036809862.1 zinc finger protein 221-like isoform X3 [Oncorhynchus mykiss]